MSPSASRAGGCPGGRSAARTMLAPASSNRSKNSRSLPCRRFAIEATIRGISPRGDGDEKIQPMAYSAGEARRQLLDDVAEATDQLALAVAALTEAYEE